MPNYSTSDGIACLSDYRRLAKTKVDENAWAYIDGASADEITKDRNNSQFRDIKLQTRVLVKHEKLDTCTQLLDRKYLHPILLAPVAYQKLAHPDGELATVQAAVAQDTPMIVSNLSSTLLEDIAVQSPSSHLWFQLYIQPSLDFTLALIRRAECAGYQAIVITVDAPINGLRNREQRVGFVLPDGISAVNLQGMLDKKSDPGKSAFEQLLQDSPTWETVAWIIKNTHLPVIIKGIMTPTDALKAIDVGAKGIVVSNHGGRALDCLPGTLEVLPQIANVVNKSVSIFIDGGVQRGTDILIAKALGADAILIGRPIMYALATAGALGVARTLRILQDELLLAMALCGYSNFEDINSDCIFALPRT